jgi:hypothetical protein
MVTCSCGKTIEKIPDWLQRVKVEFVCNNCPNRNTKNIAFVDLTGGANAGPKTLAEDMAGDLGEEESEEES